MASHLNPPFKQRSHSFLSQPMQFQRGKGKIKTKKVTRKAKLKFRHILFYFILLGGIFYSLQKSYLFLISWDNLNIKDTVIVCRNPEVKEEIQRLIERKTFGNILLCDISHLQESLTAQRWVKEIRVRKILPSTLKIEIKDRVPVAILKKEYFYLIDEEGVLLERIESREKINLPLLIDSENFQKNYEEKLRLAWECLRELSPLEKEQLEVLDLSGYENVTAQLEKQKTRLILGNDQFSRKLQLFQKYRPKLEKFGELEYADLRFPDRFIIKPKKNIYRDLIPNSKREAN